MEILNSKVGEATHSDQNQPGSPMPDKCRSALARWHAAPVILRSGVAMIAAV